MVAENPYTQGAIWDLDTDGNWILVGHSESAGDCTTATAPKRFPRDQSPLNHIAADRRGKQDEAIDTFLRLWMAKKCMNVGDADTEEKLTQYRS